MDFHFHRVERIRRVYQPGHTALSERVASVKIRFAQIKTEKSPSIQAEPFSVSLNAQEAAGQTAGEESSQSDSSVDHSSVNDSQGGADSVSEESSENSR